MKKILSLLLLFPLVALSQTTSQNYIKTITYKNPVTVPQETFEDTVAVANITYFDGLGRPIQQIAGRQANDAKDIITKINYDAFGRQPKEYLPYASGQDDLSFVDSETVSTDQENFYLGFRETTHNPYSEKIFEASPLNRVLKQAAPGDPWAASTTGDPDHTVRFEYLTNHGDEVRWFSASLSQSGLLYNPSLAIEGYYPEGRLYKTVTKDENWTSGSLHTVEEFKDKQGRIVFKRTYAVVVVEEEPAITPHDTYYVYDDFGNLTYVIPPLAVNETQAKLDGLCYQYKYDTRNRMVAKKLPGKQWEYTVYDMLDRPVLTGPAFDPWGKGDTGWMLTKYDELGRVAYTGWFESDADESDWSTRQATFNSEPAPVESRSNSPVTIDGKDVSYTNVKSVTVFKLLTVNYYDDYDFVDGPSPVPTTIEGQDVLQNVRSLATGSWVRVLDDENQVKGETSYTLYDGKSRPIYTYKQNHLDGYTATAMKLDFAGKQRYTLTSHKRDASAGEVSYREDFSYTPQDRPLSHVHTIGTNPPELIAYNQAYDALGTLLQKNVGGEVGDDEYQKVDYKYNIRGWLTDINNVENLDDDVPKNLFAFRINYNTVENDLSGQVWPLYNGNISETFWRSESDGILRKYGYKYDGLNRMNEASYQKPETTNPVPASYDEKAWYDLNGNITHLERNGLVDDISPLEIDELDYSYAVNSNTLMKVTDLTNQHFGGFNDDSNGTNDTADDYAYDANGNMISDQNKGISSITYNHLNLPVEIQMAESKKIEYLYNAAGQKVRKLIDLPAGSYPDTEEEYLDGFQYRDGELKFFPHAEGYVNVTQIDSTTMAFDYAFNYTDHLGNIRLTYGLDKASDALKILEETNYYPFGLQHQNYNMSLEEYQLTIDDKVEILPYDGKKVYKYKFQGQERQDELGLNWDSFKYRNYDPAIGRFMNVDPLTEKYVDWSPYVFSGNRVIDCRELEGLEPVSIFFETVPPVPAETIMTEGTMPVERIAFDVKLDGVTVGGKPSIGFFERIGNAIGKMWDSITGGGNEAKPSTPMENAVENAKPSAGESASPRNAPKEKGIPNSSEIEAKDSNGKTTKYSEFDKNGNTVKQVESSRGTPRHGVEGATKKVPNNNTNPKTGEVHRNGWKIEPATPEETPPGNNTGH